MRKTGHTLLALLAAACGHRADAPPATGEPPPGAPACACRAGEPCWPGADAWRTLGAQLHGRLEQPSWPVTGRDNPFALQDQSAGTESAGWLDAWQAAPPAYAVVAHDSADVAAAVRFAGEHHLRLAIKGTGHDYLGRSTAPGSLLIWTHEMRDITVHDGFRPAGCAADRPALPAVSVGAGTRWLEAYTEVTVKHGRYVQGGGCVSVGAAGGFTQGGGFGSWSKQFGTGAAGMLEAEVVTADGQVLLANDCQNQDLYWALRGGGGGTFGVVTRMTLRTHELPASFGVVRGTLQARSDAAFRELLERFTGFYRDALANPHWGEQVGVRGDDSLRVSMVFQGLTQAEAEATWKPLLDALRARPADFAVDATVIAVPARAIWDRSVLERIPGAITVDPRPDSRFWWWAGNQEEVSIHWYAYQSRYLPAALFAPASAGHLAQVLFDASRHWTVNLHFNKGLAGASADAVDRGRLTATNPAVYQAAALVIAAAGDQTPDPAEGARQRAAVTAAMDVIRAATPDAGTYGNEADYFEPDWQRSFWGD
ncbi:MAG TPA: FAD-binding protein, partial [Kofleriaceae bacterium]|nr:FAD-binding protein [Kofleriaceae bacterium]